MESKTNKTEKKENPWLIHLAAFRAAHPEIKGKDVINEAVKTYTPKNPKKPKKPKKTNNKEVEEERRSRIAR